MWRFTCWPLIRVTAELPSHLIRRRLKKCVENNVSKYVPQINGSTGCNVNVHHFGFFSSLRYFTRFMILSRVPSSEGCSDGREGRRQSGGWRNSIDGLLWSTLNRGRFLQPQKFKAGAAWFFFLPLVVPPTVHISNLPSVRARSDV